MMAFSERSKIYTLALIAVFIPILFFLERVYRSASADSVHAGRAQIYVSVKDEAAKPIPNASVQLIGGDSKITNEAGLARLDVGRNSASQVRVSASGFKEAELSVQGSSIDPNKLIVLSPTSKEPITPDKPANSPDLEPYAETVRSGPEESGLGNEFSPWYQLISPVAKTGYAVVSSEYNLSGDRRCNEWSECRVTNSDIQVIFSFRMQGHSEWIPPHPGVSEGILRVQYKPISSMSNADLRIAIRNFSLRTAPDWRRILDLQDEISKLRNAPSAGYASANLPERLENLQRELKTIENSIVQSDIPAAMQYRTEVAKRLGSQVLLPGDLVHIDSDTKAAAVLQTLEQSLYFETEKLPM